MHRRPCAQRSVRRPSVAWCAVYIDYQWLPLRPGVEEFIKTGEKQGIFQAPSVEIIDDRIIRDWKTRLAGW